MLKKIAESFEHREEETVGTLVQRNLMTAEQHWKPYRVLVL
jgi:hypothetical protein